MPNTKPHNLNNYLYKSLSDVVNKNDLTSYKELKFIRKELLYAWDKRYGNDKYTATFFIFKTKFYDSHDIDVFVNSEFGTHEKVAELAISYSKKVGQLPFFLRKKLKYIFIHGPWEDKSKCTCRWYAERNAGIYIHDEMVITNEHEEILIHEAAHVSIDSHFYESSRFPIWINAQKLDNESISKYAKKYPNREDIAESLVAWIAVRCKQKRIHENVFKKIIETIPNRLKVLDELIDKKNIYPLICKY